MRTTQLTERAVAHSARLLAVIASLALSGALACVSSGKYDSMIKERDAVASHKAQLERQMHDMEKQMQSLEEHNRRLETDLSSREAKVSELQGTYDSLVSELKGELASGQVQIEQLRDGISVNVSDKVLFPSGSVNLDETGQDVLSKVSAQLRKAPYRIEVQGHTDDVPISDRLANRYPTNWELAAARAARVVRFLEHEGIPESRLVAVSYGETRPVAPNEDPQSRALNRRIELRLKPADNAPVPASVL